MTTAVSLPIPASIVPNPTALSDTAQVLLDVACSALDQNGRGVAYTRRLYSHGAAVPVEPGGSAFPGQVTVCLPKTFLGRAGQEQYQYADGAPGRFSFLVAAYDVEVTRPWPKRQGVTAQAQTDLMEAAAELWQDGLLVWSALRALAMGGVTTVPSLGESNQVHIGQMVPKGPEGGMASWLTTVSVQIA